MLSGIRILGRPVPVGALGEAETTRVNKADGTGNCGIKVWRWRQGARRVQDIVKQIQIGPGQMSGRPKRFKQVQGSGAFQGVLAGQDLAAVIVAAGVSAHDGPHHPSGDRDSSFHGARKVGSEWEANGVGGFHFNGAGDISVAAVQSGYGFKRHAVQFGF
jgi:hypothetical protein